MAMPVVTLGRGEDRRLREGHLWVFSNEIASIDGPVEPGDAVSVVDARGRLVGTGAMNPHSLIAVRLFSRAAEELDGALISRRLAEAVEYRERILPGESALRLVSSEADLLPGLIVDRYDDVVVVQSLTAGIERRLDAVVEALVAALGPRAVVLRNDSPMRRYEQLPLEKRVAFGALDGPVRIEIDGRRFLVDVLEGHKTGFYLDQRDNRRVTAGLAAGRHVLDCCSYTGAWSVYAGTEGASSLTLLDTSEPSLDLARLNVEENGVGCAVEYTKADMFKGLGALRRDGRSFGLAFLDPPSLAKSRKTIREALKAYLALNRLAISLVDPGGFLVTCTCSHLMERDAFERALVGAAREAHRRARVLDVRGQSLDHPIILGLPETRYLLCVILEVL